MACLVLAKPVLDLAYFPIQMLIIDKVSKIENRADMKIGTLHDYVKALGGTLEIRAVFPEKTVDLVLGPGFRLGMGYGLSSEMIPIGPRACFWGGWGGSIVVIDLDAKLVIAYVMNRMASGLTGDPRGVDILFAAAAVAAAA